MSAEKVKKALGFLMLKPAVSSRNLTSIGLVAAFFGVYLAAGGRIAALPNVQSGDGFGAVKTDRPPAAATQNPSNTRGILQRGNNSRSTNTRTSASRNTATTPTRATDRSGQIDLFSDVNNSPRNSADDSSARTQSQGSRVSSTRQATGSASAPGGSGGLSSFEERLKRLRERDSSRRQ